MTAASLRPPRDQDALEVSAVGLTYRTSSGRSKPAQHLALRRRGRIRLRGRAERLRQGEPAQAHPRPRNGRLRGSLAVDGRKIAGPSRGVGAVFQAPVLLPWRTIEENVLLPVDVMRLDRKPATERARALLQMVGLGDFATLSIRAVRRHAASRRHRAGTGARSQLLIMDEPFAALDAITREQMATRVAADLDGERQDRDVHHPLDQRGGVPLGPDRGDVGAARPYPRRYSTIAAPRPRSFAGLAAPALAELSAEIRRSLDVACAA